MNAGQSGEATLEVFMFGGFSVKQDGRPISLGNNPTANALKMIEIIFLNNSQGISKEELLRDVFNGKNLSDKNNSFNNLLYQARHLLRDAGVEGTHYIENRRGKISVESGLSVSTDVDRFNLLCSKAELAGEEEKYRFFREAFDLYRGELLPDFMTENWVLQERERLTAELARCVCYLTETEKKRGNDDEVIRLYHRANEVDPDSRWQAGELEAWGRKGDYAGASAFFQETARYYLNEMQIPIPKNIRQVEEKLIAGEHPGMSPQDEMLLRRSAKLAGSGHKSMMAPYACPEECLGPVWQALVRNIERRGHILYILILQARTETLHGDALPAEIDEAIRKTLIDVLNTEDIYTRLAQGIYAVIPVNVRREDSLRLLRRMDERFRDLAGGESSFSGRIVRYDELPEFLETYAI